MRGFKPQSRQEADADKRREADEEAAFGVSRRHRRRRGRTESISVRTFPEIKRMLNAMADAEGKDLVEIVEDAIKMRDQSLKGNRKRG
jgi:hypothetical protein